MSGMGNEASAACSVSRSEILINQSPRPRLLIHGLTGWEASIEGILKLAPTAQRIDNLSAVRQAEWDVLVTDQPLWYGQPARIRIVDSNLCVVFIRPKMSVVAGGFSIETRPDWSGSVQAFDGHVSRELKRISGLPERIATLTHEQLEPVLKNRVRHQFFDADLPGGLHFPSAPEKAILEPFIASGSGRILAGRYKRGPTSEAWLLPSDIPDIIPWVRAALAEWHSLAPERFPGVPDWSETAEWMTADERDLSRRLGDLQRERDQVLKELEKQELHLRRELRAAAEAASSYERALLTAQSDELKNAVMRVLRDIGFAVTDADIEANPDDHLEDLRVQDPDVRGWIALVEVKGYTKGAKTEALTQFLRFNRRYQQQTGRLADASWYVVNPWSRPINTAASATR